MQLSAPKTFLSVRHVAERFDVSVNTVWRWPHEIESCISTCRSGPTSSTCRCAAMVMFHLLQLTLPKRLQLSDNDLLFRIMKLGRCHQRDLLKRIYARWRKVGMPRPRGYVPVSRSIAIRKFTRLFEVLDRIRSGKLKPSDHTAEESEQYVHHQLHV